MPNNPLIFAHRGHTAKHPENTMPAFESAINIGVDGVECDVQFTADKQLILFHDEKVDRLTNETGKTSKFLWTILEKLHIHGDYHIPQLEKLLKLCSESNTQILVESKSDDAGDAIIQMIQNLRLQKLATIISFNPHVIAKIVRQYPDIRTGLLLSSNRRIIGNFFRRIPVDRPFTLSGVLWQILVLIFPISLARIVRPDIVIFDQQLSSRRHIRQAHYRGFKAYSWTVNDASFADKITRWGIDGIITDEVEKIKGQVTSNK